MTATEPVDIDALLARIPTSPGVYLMKDRAGHVIYVGKAVDLRARVRQYFRGQDPRFFVAAGLLRGAVADIDTVVVENEREALLLENHLIKQHQPRFNVKLRDDKQYLVLRIDERERWPRLDLVRNIADDGASYYGPYHSAASCREMLRFVNRHFQLRTCSDHTLQSRTRPCLEYQIKRCPAPCVFDVDRDEYAAQVSDVKLFLSNKKDEVIARLRERMREHAAREQFEAAAQLRNALHATERILDRQHVVQTGFVDQDVFGFFREADRAEVVVLFIRGGKLMGRRTFAAREQELPDDELVAAFVQQYYDLGIYLPDEVVVPVELPAATAIGDWLTGLRGKRVRVVSPQRGQRTRLVSLAMKNAAAAYASRSRRDDDATEALGKLQQRLGLRRFPSRIECYDIAHIQGAEPVASMVVFVDGVADRREYRSFKIRTSSNDDFASMHEVITRRFRRALSGDAKWAPPDLLVVDGGKGQLGSAVAALEDLGIELGGEMGFDVIGLAKERELTASKEPDRVYLRNSKDAVRLRPNTAELFVLSRIRDEAHRFANTFHRKRRRATALESTLDDIPGIGVKRKRELLRHFGSVKAIRAASLDELRAVPGVGARAAEAVHRYYAEQS